MGIFSKKRVGDILVSGVLLVLCGFNALSYAENRLQDAVYQSPSLPDPNIVILGIDDRTLDEFGLYYRWSRQRMADAINILNSGEEKPELIGIDVLFGGGSDEPEADANLAEAARAGGNVVLASIGYLGEEYMGNGRIETVMQIHETPFYPLSEYASYGLANGTIDSDGVVRRALLKTQYQDEILYSFPYELYRRYTGEPLYYADRNDYAYISFYGEPGEYASSGYSFCDIFDADFDPEIFSGSIVLIGPYSNGLTDSYYTSVDSGALMHGVEIHANVLQMMLEENFKTRVPLWLNVVILAGILLLLAFLGSVLDIRILLGATVAVCAGYFFAARAIFESGFILALFYPLVSPVVIYAYQLISGYIVQAREKQRVKDAFKKYVDPKLVDRLMESGEANSDETGVLKDIAVLFVDIRGFTPMTEALKGMPGKIVEILNEYLELTSGAVFDNGGSVDKFIGDATMALFNGFVPLDDYCFRAVKAAWQMVNGAEAVNGSIKEKFGVDVGFGVGVNCGAAIVGNLGPSFRKDYTAIGDTVNTAARLESNAKRSQVLISRAVYERLEGRIEAESVGELDLKGKSEKIEVFSVTSVSV